MKTRKFFKFFLIFTILESLVSCQSPKTVYVPVYTTDSTASSHKEKETTHDTTIIEKTTIIREADSALLAQLKGMGIKVSDYERMLVIMQQQLTSQIRNQQIQNSDTATHIREVEKPVPVEVEVEVEKPLAWWQKGLMYIGALGIFAAALALVLRLRR
jgi:hypothetical protein